MTKPRASAFPASLCAQYVPDHGSLSPIVWAQYTPVAHRSHACLATILPHTAPLVSRQHPSCTLRAYSLLCISRHKSSAELRIRSCLERKTCERMHCRKTYGIRAHLRRAERFEKECTRAAWGLSAGTRRHGLNNLERQEVNAPVGKRVCTERARTVPRDS